MRDDSLWGKGLLWEKIPFEVLKEDIFSERGSRVRKEGFLAENDFECGFEG